VLGFVGGGLPVSVATQDRLTQIMSDQSATLLKERVVAVFLIHAGIDDIASDVVELSHKLAANRRQIALSFVESLRGVVRTLSIPFQYTYSQVHSLHWQRYLLAERIEAGDLPEHEPAEHVLQSARQKFGEFLRAENGTRLAQEVLERLAALIDEEPNALTAARELARQGIVLIWSAFEVLARDIFVDLLNCKPGLVERLLTHSESRRRFTVEKVDLATLLTYNFDLSSNLGTLLSQRSDLDDIQTIREAYSALYPRAEQLNRALANDELWHLFQKRNLIVHRRGIVDRQYIEKTGSKLSLGSPLWISPSEVRQTLSAVVAAGGALIREVANDG
jgi:hypothetical protein